MNSNTGGAPLNIGYIPISSSFESPGDSRRFVYYARQRNIFFEIANINKKYDFVVLTQAADLSLWCNYTKSPIIFDFIDSYYALPRGNIKNLLRGLAKFLSGQSKYLQLSYWKTLEKICRISTVIICSTYEQKEMLASFNSNIHVILDIQELFSSKPKLDYCASNSIKLVWEGLPQNIHSLKILKNVIGEKIEENKIELHVISDLNYHKYLGKYYFVDSAQEVRKIFPKAIFHEWSKTTLVNIVGSCDLAVIPIDVNCPLAAGKPENKLILFWRMGMPVISSKTKAYERAMSLTGYDFTCKDEMEWCKKLILLINSESLRKEVASAGMRVAKDCYSTNKLMTQWDQVISSLNFTPYSRH